jgi:hypothetical protein
MTQVQEAPMPQEQVRSGATVVKGAPAWEEAISFGALLGVDNVEVDGTKPSQAKRPGVHAWTWRCGVPGLACPSAEPRVTRSQPWFSGAMDLGVVGLGLLGSPSSSSPPIDWGQVERNTEQACSQDETTNRLLRKAMVLVGWDVLHPIWHSLKEKESLPRFLWFPQGSIILPFLLHYLARGTTETPESREEVIRARNVAANAEAAHAVVVCAAEASAQEATVVQESTTAVVKAAEAWTALARREAQERVLRMEAESATDLASTHGEAHQTRDTTEMNSRGLSNATVNAEQQWEEAQREC